MSSWRERGINMKINKNVSLNLFNKMVKKEVITQNNEGIKKQSNVEDRYDFSVSADELKEFFELAKKSMETDDAKIEAFRREVESDGLAVTGRDIINKITEGRQ